MSVKLLSDKMDATITDDDQLRIEAILAFWFEEKALSRMGQTVKDGLQAELGNRTIKDVVSAEREAIMKNVGERYGGAITAALLLAEFAGDQPWVHLDIAGPSRIGKPEHYLTKGSAGFGVRTLVAFAEDLAG